MRSVSALLLLLLLIGRPMVELEARLCAHSCCTPGNLASVLICKEAQGKYISAAKRSLPTAIFFLVGVLLAVWLRPRLLAYRRYVCAHRPVAVDWGGYCTPLLL